MSLQGLVVVLLVAAALAYLVGRRLRRPSARPACGLPECPAARRTFEKLAANRGRSQSPDEGRASFAARDSG